MNRLYHLLYQNSLAKPWPGGSLVQGPVQGHAVSHDLVHWSHLPVALWNDQPYESVAIYTGSATIVDGTPVLVYPGVCDGKRSTPAAWPQCSDDFQHHYNLVAARPANASDPLLQTWSKKLVRENAERDPSEAWLTADHEWRFLTWDGWECVQGGSRAASSTRLRHLSRGYGTKAELRRAGSRRHQCGA